MAIRTSLNVSLTPKLGKFVQSHVASGHYQSASEVVREGLRLLEEKERDRDSAFRELKAKLERAAAQVERGERVDPGDALRRIKALKRKRAAGKA